jgi:hypothetical protein
MFSSWSLHLMVIGLVSLPISAFAADTELVGAMKSFTGTSEQCVEHAESILRSNGFKVKPADIGAGSDRMTGTIGGFIALIICYKGVAAISVAGPKSNSVLEYDTNLWKAF